MDIVSSQPLSSTSQIGYIKKPWSSIWIIIFSLLGGPAAGFLLVWQNLKRLNREDLSKKFFIYGIIALICIEIGIIILISIGFAYVNNLGLFLSAIFPAYHELTYLHTWKKDNPKVAGFTWSIIGWSLLGLVISIIMILSIPFLIPKTNQNTPENSSNYSSLTPTPTPTKAFLQVQGKLIPINTDLALLNKEISPVSYYQAGTITSGLYKDYKRIIANYEQGFAGGSACISYTFITSDNTSYYLLDPFDREIFNASKVTKNIDDYSTVPETIELNTHSLRRYDYNTSYLEISSGESQCSLPTKTDTLLHLSSQGKTNYDYYASNDLHSSVVAGWNRVYIPDATGLLHAYDLFSPITNSSSKKDNLFSFDMGNYTFQHPESFYSKYHIYDLWEPYNYPENAGCGSDATYPKYPEFSIDFSSVKPDDFVEVEKVNATTLFILKDSAASNIYATRYNKVKKYADSFNDKKLDPRDHPFIAPSYDEYIKKHPFVFVKDAFGRFILYEEGDSKDFSHLKAC